MTSDAREFGCSGKVAFVSRSLAKRAAGRKDTRAPYRCRFCQLWHVGNDARSMLRKRKRPDDDPRELLP